VQLRQFNLSEYPTPNLIRLITMAEYFPTLFQLFLYDPKKAEAARKRLTFNASNSTQRSSNTISACRSLRPCRSLLL